MITDLAELRTHLRVDGTDEDVLIARLAMAAETQVATWIERPIYASAGDLPALAAPGYDPHQLVADDAIRAAILMVTARFFVNREGAGDGAEDAGLPASVRAILAPYRVFARTPPSPGPYHADL